MNCRFFQVSGLTTDARENMSDVVKALNHRRRQKRYYDAHKDDPEWRAKRAALQRSHRRADRVRRSIEHDDLVRAEEKSARQAKRLAAAEAALAAASQVADESESASDDSVQAGDESEYAQWDSAHLLEQFRYASGRSKYAFRRRTGLCKPAFQQLWALVEPYYHRTSMEGGVRQRDAREPVVANMLQFYLLLYWLRTVSHAFARPPARVLAIQYRKSRFNIGDEISKRRGGRCSTPAFGRFPTRSAFR